MQEQQDLCGLLNTLFLYDVTEYNCMQLPLMLRAYVGTELGIYDRERCSCRIMRDR